MGACGSSKPDGERNNQKPEPAHSKNEQVSAPDVETETSSQAENKKNASLQIEIGDNADEYLLELYQQDPIKWFYGDPGKGWKDMPDLKLEERLQKLNEMSYEELRLFRNEIYARKGYLFNDAILRGYFNQFKWYRPIFKGWEKNELLDNFKVILTQAEFDAVNTILNEEKRRRREEQYLVERNGLNLHNYDLVVNRSQFVSLPQSIENDLQSSNISIVEARRSMPFYVYDENAYEHIPHYITSDLYLFILHKYFSKYLEKLEEAYLGPGLSKFLAEVSRELEVVDEPEWEDAKDWLTTYLALASYAGGNEQAQPAAAYKAVFEEEKLAIAQAKGEPKFIPDVIFYDQLKPRSHYTSSEALASYFKCFKWLNINAVPLDEDEVSFKGLVLLSQLILSNEELHAQYKTIRETISKIAGKEDNLSLDVMINEMANRKTMGSHAMNLDGMEALRRRLEYLDNERIKPVYGEALSEERTQKRISFFAGTYSFSAEIFSKLVQIDPEKGLRTFPNGLDVPATFGHEKATSILQNEIESDWPAYTTELEALQTQFAAFTSWHENYSSKAVQVALTASFQSDEQPDFMKTDAYQRKQLTTTMASWAHVKHDLVLYQEKPFAAEAGQGGGPKPPIHYSYVEPNIEFWTKALELVEWLEELDQTYSGMSDKLITLKRIGQRLKNAAIKQETGGGLSNEEMDDLWLIGGDIEHLLMAILESYDHVPEREKSTAIITDVYAYNGISLLSGVGHMDDLYALIPIRGVYYIARGTSFSYYEFTGGVSTDESWRRQIESETEPNRPVWYKEYVRHINENPTSSFQYRYVSRPGSD